MMNLSSKYYGLPKKYDDPQKNMMILSRKYDGPSKKKDERQKYDGPRRTVYDCVMMYRARASVATLL